MAVKKTTLKNGVRILTHNIPHVRSVSTGVWVDVGARDETPDESGLSHFIEHMIFKGTSRRSAFEIAKEFDAIGGQTNAFTAMETTCYHARVTDSHLSTMVDILSDIFLNSVFDPVELERERQVILQEVGMVEDSPEEYIHLLSENAFWKDHPLGQPVTGTKENIQKFVSSDLKAFFRKFYQPGRIVIAAAGRVDHEKLVGLMAPSFESIRPGNGFPKRTPPKGNSGIFIHEKDLGQIHICIETDGHSITDPRRYAAALMNTILGGNMSSRLFQEIREKKGLAYSIYSFGSSYVDGGATGIYLATLPESGPEAVRLILKELKKLKEIPVEEAILRDAREFTKAGLIMAAESVDNQMVRLAQNEIHLGSYMDMDEIIDKVEQVTPGDILKLANEIFKPHPICLTVLGPVKDKSAYEDLIKDAF